MAFRDICTRRHPGGEMTDRERFEQWWRQFEPDCIFERFSDGNALGYPPGVYTVHRLQHAYEAWQAATAAAEADKWAAVRACVDTINCYSYVGDRSKEMLVAIKAEFPEAFK